MLDLNVVSAWFLAINLELWGAPERRDGMPSLVLSLPRVSGGGAMLDLNVASAWFFAINLELWGGART